MALHLLGAWCWGRRVQGGGAVAANVVGAHTY
jgi:hypothetical protein